MKVNLKIFLFFIFFSISISFFSFLNLCSKTDNKKRKKKKNNKEIMIEFINNVVPKLTTQWCLKKIHRERGNAIKEEIPWKSD